MGSGDWFKTIISLRKSKEGRSKKAKGILTQEKLNASKSNNYPGKESSGLTNGIKSENLVSAGVSVETIAATRIQTAFRAYKARKALRRMKGFTKLKILTEGFSVKKQASTAVTYLHSWSKIQAEIRARRICMVTEDRIRRKKLESQLKLEAKLHDLEVEWCGGSETMEEILGRIHHREEAAVKRERAMAYAFSHQWRANSSQNQLLGNYELSKANWGWSWKECWIAARPWESRIPSLSVTPEKAQHKQPSPSKVQKDKNTSTPKTPVSFNSSIAKGELMLFPYNIMENLSGCRRWTINDSDTTASAVYTAVGSPALFRLKYGWFYMLEPGSFGIPSTPTPDKPDVAGSGNANLEETLCGERDKVRISKEYKATEVGNAASETVSQKVENATVDPMDNEPRISSSLQQPSSPWIDSLSNISIGGLLSEASLFGGLDPKSFAGIQPCDITSDSLDAFIAAAQINNRPVPRLPADDLRTSILDAEETCHAFPLRKLSSPTDVQAACGKDYSAVRSQDVSSNLLKFSNADKVNDQDGASQNPPSGKTQTDLLLSSRPYDDDRSLGLTGINWNDSMGPFDLGMPAQKLNGGDSLSIGGFVK